MNKKPKRKTSVLSNPNKHVELDSGNKNNHFTWQQAMEGFLFLKKAHGISDITIKGYSNHISHFYNRFINSWNDEYQTKQSIMNHMADDIKPATYNLRLIYLRAFFDWCIEEGFIHVNPLEHFKKRKAEPRIVDIPQEVIKRLLTLPDLNTFAGLRDYALMLCTIDCGVRPSEAFQLVPYSFDLPRYNVTIAAEISKTRSSRILPILPYTSNILRRLISVRLVEWSETVPVFCNNEGNKLTRHTWNDRLEIYSRKLEFKIRPYDLRHFFAITYLRNGGSAFALQKMLGHENMDMSKRYLNITGQDLKDVHQQASPLNNLITKKKTRIRKL
ncbi:tyrosine-type recombinase/integrase [Fictibacillus barbaricus]|uniref:Site-specific recombinase XerD n=1 Tax=Fictibacillus barbaricus TaxID=182136 RepID=A0ABU1U5I7_9BACL|nr:tyrosine-type recombinase/integrase [Fictibacillus barbaricus]MDR7074749.1 site-specific recombinase XerD [Fictibacillus barbaricus]